MSEEIKEKDKNMLIDMTYIITTLICLCPMIYGVVMWDRLPDPMPVHFGLNGEPDRWGSRWMDVFFLPLIMVFVNTMLSFSFNYKAKKMNQKANSKFAYVMKWFVPIVALLVNFVSYSYALGYKVNVVKVLVVTLSLLYVIIGNYFPKAENWMINSPISDEEKSRVKRVLGWGFVCTGLVSFGFSFTPFGLLVFFFCSMFVAVLTVVTVLRARKKDR